MTQHLFIFQIGPVQAFIAQARRTADLYTGSRILSMIARAGVEKAQENGAQMLFPVPAAGGQLPKSIPHRFAFTSNTPAPQGLGNQIETALRAYWWNEIAAKVSDWLHGVIGEGRWTKVFKAQAENWLEVYWVAVPIEAGKTYGDTYKAAGGMMAARKAARHFYQIDDEAATKCTMTGAAAALPIDWGVLHKRVGESWLREHERLSAIAIIKRFADRAKCDLGMGANVEHFRSTTLIAGNTEDQEDVDQTTDLPYPYLAVLHMDGDSMGKRLGEQATEAAHRDISRRLSDFGVKVEKIVRQKAPEGELVYVGGDDVLALLPLYAVLQTANEIRKAFAETVGGTMSAGIAIMGLNTPLEIALESARQAEERAKEVEGKNAVAISDIRSSAIRESVASWVDGGQSSDFCQQIDQIQTWIKDKKLSGKLGYEMLEIAHNMFGAELKEARRVELKRLIKRRTDSGKKLAAEEADRLLNFLTTFAEQRTWTDAANWVILARFLSKGGQRA